MTEKNYYRGTVIPVEEQEAREVLGELIPHCIVDLLSLQLVYANGVFDSLFKLEPTKILGSSVLALVHEDSIKDMAKFWEHYAVDPERQDCEGGIYPFYAKTADGGKIKLLATFYSVVMFDRMKAIMVVLPVPNDSAVFKAGI